MSPLAPCSGYMLHLLSDRYLLCVRVTHLGFNLQVLSHSQQIVLLPGKRAQWVRYSLAQTAQFPLVFPLLCPVPAAEAVLSSSQTLSLPLLLPLSWASSLLGLAYNMVCGAGTKMTGLPPSRRGNTFIGPSVQHGD